MTIETAKIGSDWRDNCWCRDGAWKKWVEGTNCVDASLCDECWSSYTSPQVQEQWIRHEAVNKQKITQIKPRGSETFQNKRAIGHKKMKWN